MSTRCAATAGLCHHIYESGDTAEALITTGMVAYPSHQLRVSDPNPKLERSKCARTLKPCSLREPGTNFQIQATDAKLKKRKSSYINNWKCSQSLRRGAGQIFSCCIGNMIGSDPFTKRGMLLKIWPPEKERIQPYCVQGRSTLWQRSFVACCRLQLREPPASVLR